MTTPARNDALLPADLTATERAQLEKLEAVIERGRRAFVEVGEALLEIRDNRLYRETHQTFDEYCQKVWDIGVNYANKQIAAATVASDLEERVGTAVPNEWTARELGRIKDPKKRATTWAKLTEGKEAPPKHEEVQKAVQRAQPKKRPKKPDSIETPLNGDGSEDLETEMERNVVLQSLWINLEDVGALTWKGVTEEEALRWSEVADTLERMAGYIRANILEAKGEVPH